MTRLFTKRGYDSITEEINFLWNEERPMVLQEVHDAALQGDRSENAAYIYGKQRMRMIDKRLRILRQKIKDVSDQTLQTITDKSEMQRCVKSLCISTVSVASDQGRERRRGEETSQGQA